MSQYPSASRYIRHLASTPSAIVFFSEYKSDLMQRQKIRLEKHMFAASAASIKNN